jgi:16S rRNA (guanine527-N7)-methyltransferase
MLLDYGSGAGFPGLPIALCRPEMRVMLAESQGKKAAFLQEAVRVLRVDAEVYAHRAEGLSARFDCVTLRAVDRMEAAVRAAAGLVVDGGWLVLMTTRAELAGLRLAAGAAFSWTRTVGLAGSEERVVAFGRKEAERVSG